MFVLALYSVVVLLLIRSALDPCDGVNAEPVLNFEYTEVQCPAALKMDNRAEYCSGWKDTGECIAFCQMRTIFTRAQEAPFALSECHWPMECELSAEKSASWNWGINVTPKMGKAYKLGISGGYGETYGTSTGHSWKFTPAPHECGYFTFVPIKKTTVGVITSGQYSFWKGCYGPETNHTNIVEQVWKRDGQPDGVVIFVKINCIDRCPLPMDQQDPIYAQPGVALDRGTLSTMLAGWVNNTCMTFAVNSFLGFVHAFEIHGKNFAEGPLGENGEHLKAKIDACGDTRGCNWGFHRAPDDGDWDWKATGCLSQAAHTSCIGDAVLAVGGRFRDGCT